MMLFLAVQVEDTSQMGKIAKDLNEVAESNLLDENGNLKTKDLEKCKTLLKS